MMVNGSDRRLSPAESVRQARNHLAWPACTGPACAPGYDGAARASAL